MKKSEIKEKLINEYGSTSKALSKLNKKQLLEILEIEEKNSNSPIDVEKKELPKIEKIIEQNSPEWTQYVLSQFEDDELEGKNPKVDGLRRVTELLIGDIEEEGCDLVSAPSNENEMRACVKAWIIIRPQKGKHKRYEALADAYSGNCTEKFNTFITALADTRAKGRCFRNALKLRQVHAAEEMQAGVTDAYVLNDGKIDQSQMYAINLISDRKNMNLKDILTSLEIDHETDSGGNVNLSSLSNGEARKILQKLNKIETKE